MKRAVLAATCAVLLQSCAMAPSAPSHHPPAIDASYLPVRLVMSEVMVG